MNVCHYAINRHKLVWSWHPGGPSASECSINRHKMVPYDHETQEDRLLFNILANRKKLVWSWILTRTVCYLTFYQQTQNGMNMNTHENRLLLNILSTNTKWYDHEPQEDRLLLNILSNRNKLVSIWNSWWPSAI